MAEEYVIMPKADYAAACDAIRRKTGKTAVIKSGDLSVEIDSIEAGNSGGTGGSGTVEWETTTITAPECKATYVDKYNNVSQPTQVTCTIDGSNSWVYRTFLQYDLSAIPAEAEILSATLQVYVASGNDNYKSSKCYIGLMLGEWEEATSLNWNTQPAHQGSDGGTTTPQISPSIGISNWLEIDITAIVKQWHYGIFPNYGVILRAVTEGSYRHNWNIYNRRKSTEYATRIEVSCKVPV